MSKHQKLKRLILYKWMEKEDSSKCERKISDESDYLYRKRWRGKDQYGSCNSM